MEELNFDNLDIRNGYNSNNVKYIYNYLDKHEFSDKQIAVILANVIAESGADPLKTTIGSGKYHGLLQWDPNSRYKIKYNDSKKELDDQLTYLLNTYNNYTDKKSWTHGGEGSGYNSFKDAVNDFNSDDLYKSMTGFTLGYVRPGGKWNEVNNRYKIAQAIYNRIMEYNKKRFSKKNPVELNQITSLFRKGGSILKYNKKGLLYKK